MATLAEQLESALEGTESALSASNIEDMLSGTATSIKPGAIIPMTPQQSNQLSWNNVFKKISEGIALKPGEGLPEVPKNIPASTFYRTATQSGKLPAGASQFFTKPLAPETPTTASTTTPTTTPATTTSTTSAQNVGRQLQEAFDLQVDDGGQEPQDPSFDAAMEQYQSEMTALGGYGPSDDVKANVKGNNLLNSFLDFTGFPTSVEDVEDKVYGKIDAISENTIVEGAKIALGFALPTPVGLLAGPVLDIMTSEGMGQIGRTGIDMNTYWNPGGASLGPSTMTSVVGFNSQGMAVDINGNPVGEYNPNNPQRHGLQIFGFPTKAGIEAENKAHANKARDEYEAANPYGSVQEQADAAKQSAAQNLAENMIGGYTETAESGSPHGDKIICTMMNRMYGLGNYRAKQWLLYSNRYLTPEHQLGYHKLYCKLVSMMPSNKIIAKVLSHVANKRTDDIVAEMKGTKRSWLGRLYRATLIDTPSYVVGLMIKRNWLKPADISVLN